MKKLIALLTLFLAFAVNANAQSKKLDAVSADGEITSQEAAKRDVGAFLAKIEISQDLKKTSTL